MNLSTIFISYVVVFLLGSVIGSMALAFMIGARMSNRQIPHPDKVGE